MNPFLKDIMATFEAAPPRPARFTLDVEYDPDTAVNYFVVYADQWHKIPGTKLEDCAVWLNAILTTLRDKGMVVSLEKRDAAP